jgi:S1-C subfamily serine protease
MRAALLASFALALGATLPPSPARGGDAPGLALADDLSSGEAEAGRRLWAATVRLATAPEGFSPPAGAAEASGLVATADGVVATTARVARRLATLPSGIRAYARIADGAWTPVTVVGRAPYARTGVLRLPARPRPYDTVPFGATPRLAKPRLVAVVLGSGADVAVRAVSIATMEWVDPAARGGRLDVRRTGNDREGGRGAYVIAMRAPEAIAGRGAEGTPVVDAAGRCLGLVVEVDGERGNGESVRVVASDVVEPWLARIAADGGYDPAEVGLVFDPVPGRPGEPVRVPADLATMRAGGKERGGTTVAAVPRGSPAMGIVWPGELVVELDGRALVGEVPESFAMAGATVRDGVPIAVVAWRGGKRETLSVTPRRRRDLPADLVAVLEATAARFDP